MNETLVWLGDAVKALGAGRIGGYLVVFGDALKTDLQGEYFDAHTDFDVDWETTTTSIYYQHGMDSTLKQRVLGKGSLRKDEIGVWVEAQMTLRDKYERAVYTLAEAGKLGWSSGTAAHLVERDAAVAGKAVHIKRWPLGLDASLTPTPAEPRTAAITLKTLMSSAEPEASPETPMGVAGATPVGVADAAVRIEVTKTDDQEEIKVEETQGTPPAQDERVTALEGKVQGIGDKIDQVLRYIQEAPAIKNAGYFTQDGGAADAQIKNLADFVLAVKRGDAQRLEKVYGSVKDIIGEQGGQGGYLLPTEYRNEIMQIAEQASPVVQRVQRFPVQGRSGEWPSLDFFTAPTAGAGNTAKAGKLVTGKRAEGGAYAETQPEFEIIKWQLSDAASGYVEVSKEMSQDFVGMASLLRSLIGTAVSSKLEYFILRGNGVGEPLGILNAPALVSVTVDTNNVFAYADAAEMMSRHKNVSGRPSVWIYHPGVITDIATFTVGSGSPTTFVTNLTGALPMALLGYGMIASEHLPQADTSGFVILCDLGAYGLFEKGGLYIDFSEHAAFTSGKDTWRFGQRVDGQPLWKGTHTLADPQGGFTVSPFVKGDD